MLSVLCVLCALCGVAGADPDELGGGAFVAHYVAELTYSSDPPSEGWCAAYEPYAIGDLGEATPAIYGQNQPAVWYVIAAWETGEKTWCGTEFGFGAYDPAGFEFTQWGPCYPTTGLEIPTGAWPGPLAGTAIVTSGTPWSGNWQPVYYFAGYAGSAAGVQASIPVGLDPATQWAGAVNCQNPPTQFFFAEAQRGALGINTPGTVPSFPPPLEAVCCLPSGACEILTEADCLAASGTWMWWIASCDPNPCPGEPHVCCFADGGCGLLEGEEACTALGGVWHPEWNSCDPNPCPQPAVCCVEGECIIVYGGAQACGDLGGTYHPEWTECIPNPCPVVCCFADGSCQLANMDDCQDQGGTWRPDLGHSCDPNPCPGPAACCVYELCYIVYSAQECDVLGGVYHPEWNSCDPNPCIQLWVCCFPDGSCQMLTHIQCLAMGGTWDPTHPSCEPNPCPQPAVCCVYGTCYIVHSATQCGYHPGGVYHPEWRSCDPNPCPQEAYVCCFNDGSCQLLVQSACLQTGGSWRPDLGQSCDPNPCPAAHVCCVYNECMLVMSHAQCLAHPGGVYYPEWTSCDPNPCPQRHYVCCLEGGACLVLLEPECLQAGGAWHPELGSSCLPNPCEQEPMVCCLEGGVCELLTPAECLQAGGQWRPDLGESCEPNPCSTGPSGPHNLAGGALFAHYVPELPYTTEPPAGGWCEAYQAYPIQGVGDLNTRIDVQGQAAATWFVLAAWEGENKTWCGAEFGLGAYDPALFAFAEVQPCYPVGGGLELPTGGWPGPGQGTAIVTTGTPWEGNWVPVYFFGGYAYAAAAPGQIPIDLDPATGFIGFSNCLMPPTQYDVAPAQRGVLGINTDGYPASGPANQKVCCLPDRDCLIRTLYECDMLGGIWHPEWASCDPNPCPAEPYVCCLEDGSCELLTEDDCAQAGGQWRPDLGRSCDPNPCPHPSICCVYGECFIVHSPEECYAHPGGIYYPMWESCDPNPCPQEAYVCCLPGGACEVLTEVECALAGGEWRPDLGQSCTPNPCGYAVCCHGIECTLMRQADCLNTGGDWYPEWLSCEPNPCDMYVPARNTSWGQIKRLFR